MEHPSGGNQQPGGTGCFRGEAPLLGSGWVPDAPPVGRGGGAVGQCGVYVDCRSVEFVARSWYTRKCLGSTYKRSYL